MSVCLLQDGMGQLKVVPGGLQLSGQAWVLDMLRASNIRSRYGQPITLGRNSFHMAALFEQLNFNCYSHLSLQNHPEIFQLTPVTGKVESIITCSWVMTKWKLWPIV